MSTAPCTLVTGFPGFLAKHLVRFLATAAPEQRLVLLVEPSRLDEARRQAAALAAPGTELLSGDVSAMHLGLSGAEYEALCRDCVRILHLAAAVSLGVPRETAWRVNVDGARNVIELASDCKRLERLVHMSTITVSGDRVGVVAEDELAAGQGFRNAYEETKYEAERLMQRAKAELPVTVVRPATVVGDSQTGETDRFEGPYWLGVLFFLSPLTAPLPLPGEGAAPLHLVPVDYVVRATWALAMDPAAVGCTVHLVDPHPLSARRVYELIAERARKRPSRVSVSAWATDWVLRLPGVERLARPQRAALSSANQLTFYTSRTAEELLARAGPDGGPLRCPPLTSYLDRLMDFAMEHWRRRPVRDAAVTDAEPEDPLDERRRA